VRFGHDYGKASRFVWVAFVFVFLYYRIIIAYINIEAFYLRSNVSIPLFFDYTNHFFAFVAHESTRARLLGHRAGSARPRLSRNSLHR
jgi:hypothetical protein